MVSRKIRPIENTSNAQPRHELLQVAEIVAREKSIEIDEVLEAMEEAIKKAARARYGMDHDIELKLMAIVVI